MAPLLPQLEKFSTRNPEDSGLYMKPTSQQKYAKTEKGKAALTRAQKKYDDENIEKRRIQKREYMRRKRAENPGYCKWK